MNQSNYQDNFALFILSVLIACAILMLGEWLVEQIRRARKPLGYIPASRANDCKPGCFQITKSEEWME
jgi:hypothetical protein